MGEKIVNVLATIVIAGIITTVVTSPLTAAIIRETGGAFSGAITASRRVYR